MNQLPTRTQLQTVHPLSHGGFRPRASTHAALAFRPQAHHMPPPGLGHRSLPGPPLPAWSLHDWAPPPPLWCSSRNFSAIPPTPTPASTRSSSSSRGGWSLDPLGRVLTQEAWPGRAAHQVHWNPPHAACWQATACCCQPTGFEGQRRQCSAQAQSGKRGGSGGRERGGVGARGVAWGEGDGGGRK